MKAADWIDRIKKARGWDSDYRVSKELGVRPQTVSNYRSDTGRTMDEAMSIKVAAVLGEKPEAVVLDQVAERAEDPGIRTALRRAAKALQSGAITVATAIFAVVIATLFVATDARAARADDVNGGHPTVVKNLHIVEC